MDVEKPLYFGCDRDLLNICEEACFNVYLYISTADNGAKYENGTSRQRKAFTHLRSSRLLIYL